MIVFFFYSFLLEIDNGNNANIKGELPYNKHVFFCFYRYVKDTKSQLAGFLY